MRQLRSSGRAETAVRAGTAGIARREGAASSTADLNAFQHRPCERVADLDETHAAMAVPLTTSHNGVVGERLYFVASRQADGTYSITLTEEGVQSLETALGLADDFGGRTRLSPHSTIADLMERTATREELSSVLRDGDAGAGQRLRILVLRRKLRGTEQPLPTQAAIGHLAKALIVLVVALGALQQFAFAIADITAIPGILAHIPSDILNLHPTAAFGEVGNRIADAGRRALFGVLMACVVYLVARAIRPLDRIYRQDQLIPGERTLLRVLSWTLRRNQRDSHKGHAVPRRR